MSVQDQAVLTSALMRAVGITKLRVPEEFFADTKGSIITVWHDPVSHDRVFYLRLPGEVIDGEEVPLETLAIKGGAR